MSAAPEAADAGSGFHDLMLKLQHMKEALLEQLREDERLYIRVLCDSFIRDIIFPRKPRLGDRVDAAFALNGTEFEEGRFEKHKETHGAWVVVKKNNGWMVGDFLLVENDDEKGDQIVVLVLKTPKTDKSAMAMEFLYFKSGSDVRLCDFPRVLPEHIRIIKRIWLWAHKSNNVFGNIGVDSCGRICLHMVDYAHKWRLEW